MSSHVFGPVPSRRLGRSLGIDLVPFKTCSYDCIYCQLGPTTCCTVDRQTFVPLDVILQELEQKLDTQPDYITLSGSGEPTLFRPIDRLIAGIRTLTAVPVAVLTNGSLLHDERVQAELAAADLIIPSLDAGDEVTFQQVNRPHASLDFQSMLEGLVAFRRRFPGPLWLEVFLLDGVSTTPQSLTNIRRCVDLVRPDRVQLNTVARPPAEETARGVPRDRLEEIAALFSPPAEVVAEFHSAAAQQASAAGREEVLQLLRRRPCAVDDLVGGLRMHRHEVLKCLEHLQADGLIACTQVAGRRNYRAAQ